GPRGLSGVLDDRERGLLVGVRGAQRGDDGGAAVAGQRHLQAVLDHLGDLTALADGRVGRGAGPEGALTGDGEGAPVVLADGTGTRRGEGVEDARGVVLRD